MTLTENAKDLLVTFLLADGPVDIDFLMQYSGLETLDQFTEAMQELVNHCLVHAFGSLGRRRFTTFKLNLSFANGIPL